MHKPGFTRRQLAAVICFALLFAGLFLCVEKCLFSDIFFSPTWTRIREERKAPQVLVMGNSHAFCSFAPQIINGALGVDSAVLGASGQNAAGAVDSFEAVLRVDAPEVLVAELNVFLSPHDSMAVNSKASALSNINGMPHLWQRVKSAYHELGFESIPQGAFQLLRADLMWARWNQTTEIHFSPDGSSHLNWHATGEYDAASRQADALLHLSQAEPLEVESRNVAELRRMMTLAEKHGVKVVLVKTPTIASTQETCNRTVYLMNVAAEYGDTLLGARDFHQELGDMGFVVEDFYDKGHLSRSGAAKLTMAVVRWMGGLLGTEPRFENAFAYAGEQVEAVSDNTWRYSMTALGRDVQYRFALDEEILQDWGSLNAITLALAPEEAGRLRVDMRQVAQPEKVLTMSFMTANTCVIR